MSKKKRSKPPFPNPFEEELPAVQPLPLDEQGIPILEDVVEQHPASEPSALDRAENAPADSVDRSPDADREQLRFQVEQTLEQLIEQALPAAIAAASRTLETALRAELKLRLERQLSGIEEDAETDSVHQV